MAEGNGEVIYSGDIVIPSSFEYEGKTYTVTSIDKKAFNHTYISSVLIPNTVTSIGAEAFCNNALLTSINIPKSVIAIAGTQFRDCNAFTAIKVEEGNPVYDSRNNCNAIIETATNTLILGCKNTIIPNTVTSIGTEAFLTCLGLNTITILKTYNQ